MNKPLLRDDLEAMAAPSFWDDLKKTRVLFTGASGFFGSWLLESFLFASDVRDLSGKALVLTRNARRFAEKLPHLASHRNVELIEGNAQNFTAPPGAIDAIIHSLVPDAGTSLPDSRDFFQQATASLLRLALHRDCRHFLLCSTGAVYQPSAARRPFVEDDPLVPLDGPLSYGQIRRKVEEQCLQDMTEHNVPLKIARGFTFAGPRLPLDADFAFGNFLRDGLAGQPILIQGDGTAIRSYLYAADMTTWLWTILLRGRIGEVFNAGSASAISIADLACMIGKFLNVHTLILGKAKPGTAPSYYVPDVQKAARHFGLSVSTNMTKCIENNVRWHLQTA